jgi:autotransporter-associated beta strand protein
MGSGALVLNGTNSYTGPTTVNAGSLQLKQLTSSRLTINGGKVVLASSGGLNPNASVISAANLPTIITPGSLDLTDNGLLISGATASTRTAIANMIQSNLITSSVVGAHGSNMTVAYDFASNVHLTYYGGLATWGGQTITISSAATDLLVLPTVYGDANMDGSVNSADLSPLIASLGKTGTWGSGDFTGDGTVNSTDVSLLIPNLGESVYALSGPGLAPGAVTAAPEPASLALLTLGGVTLLWRRYRV